MLIEAFRCLFLFALLLQSFENIKVLKTFLIEKKWIYVNYTAIFWILLALFTKSFNPLVAILICRLLIYQKIKRNINGANDSLSMVILLALTIGTIWQNYFMACLYYIVGQILISYFIAGISKVRHSQWHSGVALEAFMKSGKYAASPSAVVTLNAYPFLYAILSWTVILYELSFPLAFISTPILKIYLLAGVFFHLANFFVFGLNRFFWLWISTYPLLFHMSLTLF